jgi:hypothetical protein
MTRRIRPNELNGLTRRTVWLPGERNARIPICVCENCDLLAAEDRHVDDPCIYCDHPTVTRRPARDRLSCQTYRQWCLTIVAEHKAKGITATIEEDHDSIAVFAGGGDFI